MVTKILALVIILGAALTSSISARTMSMEKDSFDMQKTFFHPFFPPGLGHGIGFGGGKGPGFGGVPGGFPSAGTGGVLGGGLGAGFSGAVGSTAGDRSGSSNRDAVVGGGLSGSGVLGEEDSAGAAGGGQP